MEAGTHDERWRAIEAMHPASFAWARACAVDPDDAEDIMQTVYEKVLSGRARFGGRSSLKTWLFGVIRLTALEHRRRGLLRALRLVPMTREPAVQPAMRDDASTLIRALAQLPARQREVLHLVFYEDLTVNEAAATMGVSAGSARTHYDRGKKRLRALLTEAGEDR